MDFPAPLAPTKASFSPGWRGQTHVLQGVVLALRILEIHMLQPQLMGATGVGNLDLGRGSLFFSLWKFLHKQAVVAQNIAVAFQIGTLLGQARQPGADAGGHTGEENEICYGQAARHHAGNEITIDQTVPEKDQQLLAQLEGE